MSSYASVLCWFFIYVCSTVIDSWFWISLKYEVRPVVSCCFCSSKFGDGSPATPASRVNQPWREKKPTCWRQQRSSSFTAMETSFTRSTSAEIDKNAIEGPHALTVLHYILVTPDYSDDLARQRQNTHLNTKVTSVVPSVSKTPKSETWFMWRLGSRIQFTSIYPRMLVGLCLSWTILIIS